MFCNKIGNKSFTLSYEIYVDGQLKTTGSSTLVGYNTKQQKSIQIPIKIREALLRITQN